MNGLNSHSGEKVKAKIYGVGNKYATKDGVAVTCWKCFKSEDKHAENVIVERMYKRIVAKFGCTHSGIVFYNGEGSREIARVNIANEITFSS